MMENENMMTEIIEDVVETGAEEIAESTSGMNAGVAMVIGSAITVAAIGLAKLVVKGIGALKAKKKPKTITRTVYDEKDDDITEDNLDITDIEP